MIIEIGKHKVQHNDIMNGIKELMGTNKADIMYTDPPWGAGNLKYWQTINSKNNGVPQKEIDFTNFIWKIFETAKDYTKNLFFVEYGVRWHDTIKELGNTFGFVDNGTIKMKYKAGNGYNPLDLHIFSKKKIKLSEEYIKSVTDTHGYNTLKMVITPFAGKDKIILDPCCGMGYTAQIALDNNMIFRGNEINKKRLDKTIARLGK